jgi:hypothetical protein
MTDPANANMPWRPCFGEPSSPAAVASAKWAVFSARRPDLARIDHETNNLAHIAAAQGAICLASNGIIQYPGQSRRLISHPCER